MRWMLLALALAAAYLLSSFPASTTGSEAGAISDVAAPVVGSEASNSSAEADGFAASVGDAPDRVAVDGSFASEGSIAVQSKPLVAPNAPDSFDSSDAAGFMVRFTVLGDDSNSSDAAGLSLIWVDLASPGSIRRLALGTDETTTMRLSVGTYRCACQSEDGVYGPAVGFEVLGGEEPLAVELAPPGTFELRTVALNNSTDAPLQGVRVAIERGDVVDIGEVDSRELVTDATGAIVFENLAAGEWSFSLLVDGFAESSFTLSLPGTWSSQLKELGHLDFGALKMAPITPLLVELDGHSDWFSGESGFRIATGPDDEPVLFDDAGHATVPLGWLSNPVYLKLYYPNSQRLGLYLDSGLPERGTPVVIEVGKGRTLEIDVQASQEIKDVMDFGVSSFNVTGRTPRGDSLTQGASVNGLGVHRVEGVAASTVRVSFSTKIEGRVTVLTSEAVTMKEAGVTTCTLLIDSVPRRLVLKGRSWQPSEGTYAEVRPSPDVTSWLHGNAVNEDGSILLPDLRGHPHSLRLLDPDRGVMAIDLPIAMPSAQGPAEMTIQSPRKTRTRVLIDGEPASGIPVAYTGADSNAVCALELTDAEGWTPSWGIVEGSRLLVQPKRKELWGAQTPHEHPGGDFTIKLRSTGRVRVPIAVDLDLVSFSETEETLGDWARKGLVGGTSTTQLIHEYLVPVGQYVRIKPDGTASSFEITSATSTTLAP